MVIAMDIAHGYSYGYRQIAVDNEISHAQALSGESFTILVQR